MKVGLENLKGLHDRMPVIHRSKFKSFEMRNAKKDYETCSSQCTSADFGSCNKGDIKGRGRVLVKRVKY